MGGTLLPSAAALAACALLSLAAAQDGLPSAWMTGIATNYGGAQDGMVRINSLLAPLSMCGLIALQGTKCTKCREGDHSCALQLYGRLAPRT